jgi:hypothetical protein
VQVAVQAVPALEETVLGILRHHLETLPERIRLDPTRYADALRTTDALYNVVLQELMERQLSNRGLTLPYLDELCRSALKEVAGKWYLPSDKQAHLAHRLHEAVPQGAKLALCFDPEGDLDGCETILDTTGRAWRMLTYQEDDLAFRLAIRELEVAGWNADAPVVLRVAMPAFVPLTHRIELSFLGDVLQRVEGEPIDLRTDAVVTCYTEPVVWPESLQTYAARISRDLPSFVDGYWRLRRAIGRDRPLGRHHVAAVLLLAQSRELEYRNLELSHAYPAELIARFLTLAATHRLDTEDERLLWDVPQLRGMCLTTNQSGPRWSSQ